MRGFDVLDPDLPLFENHFLEASAGTGKTFAIENIVVRMLEKGVQLNEILIVTFTRAATVELKERIQSHLTDLNQFDEAKIWTIHSFCFHCLQEHALQTGFPFDQIEESASIEELKQIVKDYLRTSTNLTPKQLQKAVKGNPEALIRNLISIANNRLPIEQPDWDYQKEIDLLQKVNPEKLLEDLYALAPQYGKLCDRQKRVKPDVEEGLRRFTSLFAGERIDPVDLPILKYVDENKLKRNLTPKLHYPDFLKKLQIGVIPKLATFSDRTAIFAHLAEGTRLHLERVVEKEELIFFEDLIRLMAKHIENPLFAHHVRSGFKAVLIDEFQDTDPLQWKIFSTLFLTPEYKGTLYLVGDPKQSIYRFRNANLYTYFAAKKEMGEKTHASLQTNFRSTPSLVYALNSLFSNLSISLPKTGETISCPPVEAAAPISPLEDGKGSLHFLEAENEEVLFSTIVHEIERLHQQHGIALQECAVLVSDRYQASRFIDHCPLPVVTKKSRSLLDSPAFETLLELIHAAQNPRDRSSVARVLGGPLFGYHLEHIPQDTERFYRYHHLLVTEGLLSFFQTVIQESSLSDGQLYQDLLQLVEMGVHHKEDYLSFYHNLMHLDPDSEQLRARATVEEDAIQVMTIHVSKGLEFSVVFPIGLITPSIHRKGLVRSEDAFLFTDNQAEDQSEKMRLLYVACTRAKQRLYLPLLDNDSPLSTFLKRVDLQKESSEICQLYPPPSYQRKASKISSLPPLSKTFVPYAIHSYSSLIAYEPERKKIPEGILPVGAETGTLIHQLFEKLSFAEAFQAKTLVPFVSKELQGTFLEPWVDEIAQMMKEALHQPLPASGASFPLSAVDPNKIIKEMEFLYPTPEGYMKGFIDLFFEYNGEYYFIDWKTNFIDTSIEEVVKQHRYDIQAAIYQEGIERYLKLFDDKACVKGFFYYFLRSKEIYMRSSTKRK